ncbi:MAG: rane protein [Fibrobacteria bacterium]|jgi:hydrogenase/urease accessory protein HupE|nr:rane protein [Fibrobacteria bacterium]
MKTFAALLLATLAGAFAHPSGTSRIYVHVLPEDSVTVEIDVNSADVLSALSLSLSPHEPAQREQIEAYQRQVTGYLHARLRVTADNLPFLSPTPVSTVRGRGNVTWDSSLAFDTTHALTFAGKMKPGSGRRLLKINTQLFPEFGIQNLSEISVFWRDTLVERKWIGLDKTFRITASADSLDARLGRLRTPGTGTSGTRLFGKFIQVGYVHILPYGLDHILFVLGLFFFSTRLRPLFLQVTAFTVAHSITLGLALLGVFSLPPALVEPLIALSIVVVGLENVFFRKVRASRWLIVFVFGLVHGMGFAGVLQDFGLPEGGFWPALVGFNVGVELGQISVIALAFCLTVFWRNKPWYFKRVVVPVSLAISAAGLYWAIQRILGV